MEKLTLNNFAGVDFTTSPLRMSSNRASQGKNFISDYGTLKKRNGHKEYTSFKYAINGIYEYSLNDDYFLIVYSGRNFYKVYENEEGKIINESINDTSTYAPASVINTRLKDQRVQFFADKERVYIVGCGDYLVFGKWDGGYELRRVINNEDTYIPRVLVSIDPLGEENRVIGTLDRPNLLQNKRKFGLVTSKYKKVSNIKAVSNVNIELSEPVSVIGGHVLTNDDRVALINQKNANENGIYVFGPNKLKYESSNIEEYDQAVYKETITINKNYGMCGEVPTIEEMSERLGDANNKNQNTVIRGNLTVNGSNPCAVSSGYEWVDSDAQTFNNTPSNLKVEIEGNTKPSPQGRPNNYGLKQTIKGNKEWQSTSPSTNFVNEINMYLNSSQMQMTWEEVTETIYNAAVSKSTSTTNGTYPTSPASAYENGHVHRTRTSLSYTRVANVSLREFGFFKYTGKDGVLNGAVSMFQRNKTKTIIEFTFNNWDNFVVSESLIRQNVAIIRESNLRNFFGGLQGFYGNNIDYYDESLTTTIAQEKAAYISGYGYSTSQQNKKGIKGKWTNFNYNGFGWLASYTIELEHAANEKIYVISFLPHKNAEIKTTVLDTTVKGFVSIDSPNATNVASEVAKKYPSQASTLSQAYDNDFLVSVNNESDQNFYWQVNLLGARYWRSKHEIVYSCPSYIPDSAVTLPNLDNYTHDQVIKVNLYSGYSAASPASFCGYKYFKVGGVKDGVYYFKIKVTSTDPAIHYNYIKVVESGSNFTKVDASAIYAIVDISGGTEAVVHKGGNSWEVQPLGEVGNKYEFEATYGGGNYYAEVSIETLVNDEIETRTLVTKDVGSGSKVINLYENNLIVGSIKMIGTQCRLEINLEIDAPIDYEDNVILTLEIENQDAEDILDSKFGIIFGADGNSNQLFVSGSKNKPNIDYYSEAYDFTYFGDNYYQELGGSSSPIVGYSRLGDSTLVVYKRETSQESSVYFRTETLEAKEDYTTKYQFRNRAGAMGVGSISSYAHADLAGDVVFLSKTGLYGIVLSDNVATDNRYARERSRYVNAKLTKHDLSKAVGFVYENKYYLSVDSVCYVADARYKSLDHGDMDDTFNYEWFYFDNINARVWGTIKGGLAFGTDKGQILVFDNEYTDRTLIKSEDGDVLVQMENDRIIFNKILPVNNNDEIKIPIHELLVSKDEMTIEDNTINSTVQLINIYEGMVVYVDEILDSSLEKYKEYYITEISGDSFKLRDAQGIKDINNSFNISIKHEDNMYVTELDSLLSSFALKRSIQGIPIRLYDYDKQSLNNVNFVITLHKAVETEWYSASLDLGTNIYSKTMYQITISATSLESELIGFGYETRDRAIETPKSQIFDFNNIDFTMLTFKTKTTGSITKRIKERNFNYITFKFIDKTTSDFEINDFSVLFDVTQKNRGLK